MKLIDGSIPGASSSRLDTSTQPTYARLLTVIVVFERELDGVQAWPLLRQRLIAASGVRCAADDCLLLDHVLIYDNSSQPRAKPRNHIPGCIYFNDTSNGGTAAAYDRACSIAREAGIDWLLLLDQDTSLPRGFFESASAALAASPRRPCALVPWVFQGQKLVSPARVTSTGTIVPLQYKASLPLTHDLTAISSGSLLHVPTLAALMPMPHGLWLDYVDHWIFFQLRSCRMSVVVFDASLQHDLSICTMKYLNPSRLTSILNGEVAFIARLGTRARLVYPFRLVVRIFRYAWTRPKLAIHVLAWIHRRMRYV